MIDNLDDRFHKAVQAFWDARERQRQTQIDSGTIDAGTRGAVTGGTQMGGLEVLVTDILLAAGLESLQVRTRTGLELPGYYRPEKQWDLLVIADGRLVVAVEFKSQVGPSFGNNFNNRVEEAIGNSEDIWTAYREKRFGDTPPPFLGYLFLLEDCPAIHAPVRNSEPYFKVDPVFKGASYAQRYERLCERLTLERKYDATCLVLATQETPTRVTCPRPAHDFRTFAAGLDAHARRFLASSKGDKPSG
jgi:hypothetical protein